MSSDTASVLWGHIRANDLCPGSKSLEEWLHVRWIRARVAGRLWPIFPVIGYRNDLILHDVHHVVTGYDVTNVGEIEIAAWELASGGFGYNVFFWLIQIVVVLFGAPFCPRRSLAAFRIGWKQRNLYGFDADKVLNMEFQKIAERIQRST